MAKLDDPELQADLVTAVTRGDKLAAAARSIGMSRQAVTAYLAGHSELKETVDVARRRSHVLAQPPPQSLSGELATPDEDNAGSGAGALTPIGRQAFIRLLELHAADGGSRGCSKAIDILAQLHFASELMAIRAEAKRAADDAHGPDSRPVVIRAPSAQETPSEAIDVEVVDAGISRPRR